MSVRSEALLCGDRSNPSAIRHSPLDRIEHVSGMVTSPRTSVIAA
jgi:hypothetical protein